MKGVLRKGVIAAAACAALVNAQEKKFQVYGFTDLTMSKYWIEDNSPFNLFGVDENLHVDLSHVNTYFDFRPNGFTRSLVELSFQGTPVNSVAAAGQTLNVSSSDTTVVTAIGPIDLPGTKESIPLRTGSPVPGNTSTGISSGIINEWGSFSLERAWMEVAFNQYTNMRAGLFVTPAGVWNVDHGSPVILTVKQPYQTGMVPIFPKSQYGIMDKGTVFLGNADMEYSLYLSSGRLNFSDNKKNEISFESIKDVAVGGNVSFALPVVDGLKLGVSGFTGMLKQEYIQGSIDVDVTEATVDAANSAADMVLAGQLDPSGIPAYIEQQVGQYVEAAAGNPDFHSYSKKMLSKARESVFGFDAVFNLNQLTLQSELNYQFINNHLVSNSETNTLGFYGLASYRFDLNEKVKLTPYVMYERITQDGADNNAGNFLRGSNTGSEASVIEGFQTYIGGVNLRLFTNFILKAEYLYGDILTQGAYEDHPKLFDASTVNFQFSMAF